MSHYAKVDFNPERTLGTVSTVIVAEADFIALQPAPEDWIQTSYNTRGGVHSLGGTPLRKNYAGVGYIYDLVRDAFIPPKPFASWVLSEDSCLWDAPIPYPTDGLRYTWEEPMGWTLA
jgi:hypothetical protein